MKGVLLGCEYWAWDCPTVSFQVLFCSSQQCEWARRISVLHIFCCHMRFTHICMCERIMACLWFSKSPISNLGYNTFSSISVEHYHSWYFLLSLRLGHLKVKESMQNADRAKHGTYSTEWISDSGIDISFYWQNLALGIWLRNRKFALLITVECCYFKV